MTTLTKILAPPIIFYLHQLCQTTPSTSASSLVRVILRVQGSCSVMETIGYQDSGKIDVGCCLSHAKEQGVNTLVFTMSLPNKYVMLQVLILVRNFQPARSRELHPMIVIKHALEKTRRINRSTSSNVNLAVGANLTERKIKTATKNVRAKKILKSTHWNVNSTRKKKTALRNELRAMIAPRSVLEKTLRTLNSISLNAYWRTKSKIPAKKIDLKALIVRNPAQVIHRKKTFLNLSVNWLK